MVDMPWWTASDIWRKYQETGTTQNHYHSGRLKKVDIHTEQLMLRKSLRQHRKPFADIGDEQEPKLSESTVQKVLAQHNYYHCVAWRVPFLTRLQKKQQLHWANTYKTFTEKDWSRVIWSDECYIELDDHWGPIYVTSTLR